MKQKDMIGLVVALVVLIGASVLLYSQLAPAPKDSGIKVEIPKEVKVPLDQADNDGKTQLKAITDLVDFSNPQRCDDQPEKCTGNPNPFSSGN
ncbi:MAG: hypothetical protein WCI47_02495 [bacterium]